MQCVKKKHWLRNCLAASLLCLLSFAVGVLATNKLADIRWLGYATTGKDDQSIDPNFAQGTKRFIPEVDSSVVIGLRADGVVVWKRTTN